MLIVGAKGFAKEVLEILVQNGEAAGCNFFDDTSVDSPELLYDRFSILKTEEQARAFFLQHEPFFTLGLGKPALRRMLCEKMERLGGILRSTISPHAELGSFNVEIGEGCNILGGARISNDVRVGRGCIIYYNCIITHDVVMGNFVEMSPGATVLGRASIGDDVQLGSGAIVFPDVKVGKGAVIAAGAVVRHHVPANCMVAGIPAVIKRQI